MLTILFWNLMGNHAASWPQRVGGLRSCLASLAATHAADLVLLAESAFVPADVVTELNSIGRGDYRSPPSVSQRVQVFSRLPKGAVQDQYDSVDGRLTVRRVQASAAEILVAAVHFHSKLHLSELEQALEATALHANVEQAENDTGCRRTVLIGDLNMNPFDPGVAGSLHAVMTRGLTEPGERTVAGRRFPLFYNPMWSFFGDWSRPQQPSGTLFYSSGTHVNYYWNMFDQVLVRPELVPALADVQILTRAGPESLLTSRGRPRDGDLSDHLPILCRLDV